MTVLTALFASAVIVATAPGPSVPQAPVIVLGLPLGGKMPGPFPICKRSEIGKNQRFCWVDKPFSSQGALSGSLEWPGGEKRIKWAEHASLSVVLTKAFVLNSFTLKAYHRDTDAIIASITSRFGAPDYVSSPGQPFEGRNWKHKDAYVRLLCSRDFDCEITFYYGPLARASEVEAAKKEALDKARRPSTI